MAKNYYKGHKVTNYKIIKSSYNPNTINITKPEKPTHSFGPNQNNQHKQLQP